MLDGDTRTPSSTDTNINLLLNATVESDADNDGYGDERMIAECLQMAETTVSGILTRVGPAS